MNRKHNLPTRLTISFPLWAIYKTPGKNSMYDDLDRLVFEHIERGFNCIRVDSGAGFIHDLHGRKRGEVVISTDVFGKYSHIMRQQGDIYGDGGSCDLLGNLIDLCKAAKKYGVYIILSSWYYLHSYWFHREGDIVEKELFEIAPHKRFMAFAQFLDYILCELEREDLDSTIAFAEIFNEADGLPFVNGYGGMNGLSDEELSEFKSEHEAAIEHLRKRHPQILFAFDSYTPWADKRQIPSNMQVYNYHDYYLWNIYDKTFEKHPELFSGTVTEDDVRQSRKELRLAADDWYERVCMYNNLDTALSDKTHMYLEQELDDRFDLYLKKAEDNLENVKKLISDYPDVPVVCGEGVSYIGSKYILWEEKSEKYWELVEKVMDMKKKAGLWGTVVRTCCGPEDPCWNMCKEKLKYLNEKFLSD